MNQLEKNEIDFDIEALETGDVLLFSDKTYWFSRVVEYFTCSEWSHVGIVLKNPTYLNEKLTGIYLWESGLEDLPDVEDGKYKFGVQIVDLVKKMDEYNGKIVLRKINNISNKYFKSRNKNKELQAKLKVIHNTLQDCPYDDNPFDLLCAWLQIDPMGWDKRRLNRVFCSAFVGYVYTELGYLNKNTNWSLIEPKHYSEKYSPILIDQGKIKWSHEEWEKVEKSESLFQLPFVDGFTLEQELNVKS